MRWMLTGVTATLLALVGSGAAAACGCCCGKGGGSSCPNCPQGAAGGSCPNCPQGTTTSGTSRYWSSTYGCYLYYDPASRLSYYWSETQRAYYPVANSTPPGSAAAPVSRSSSIHATQYYNPVP